MTSDRNKGLRPSPVNSKNGEAWWATLHRHLFYVAVVLLVTLVYVALFGLEQAGTGEYYAVTIITTLSVVWFVEALRSYHSNL